MVPALGSGYPARRQLGGMSAGIQSMADTPRGAQPNSLRGTQHDRRSALGGNFQGRLMFWGCGIPARRAQPRVDPARTEGRCRTSLEGGNRGERHGGRSKRRSYGDLGADLPCAQSSDEVVGGVRARRGAGHAGRRTRVMALSAALSAAIALLQCTRRELALPSLVANQSVSGSSAGMRCLS